MSLDSYAPDVNVDLDIDLRSTLFNLGYVLWHETLGKGTYAVVKTAMCVQTQRKVAIKIIDLSKAPRMFVENFLPRELATVWSLKHANIIQYHKVIVVKDYTCIVMEKAQNDLLDEIIHRREKFDDEENIRKIFKGIAKGVEHLHRQNIAHRDLKLENILIGEGDEIKVSDFGFARPCPSRTTRFGRKKSMKSDTFCGSQPYAAPEILSGTKYDPLQADIWSLGVVLYILITGEFPFAESLNSDMVEMQMRRQWCIPRHLRGRISGKCERLLEELLEPSPKHRLTAAQVLKKSWLRDKHAGAKYRAHSF